MNKKEMQFTEEQQQIAAQARREYMRAYRAKRRAHINRYHREWSSKNKSKISAAQDRYWLKKAQQAE